MPKSERENPRWSMVDVEFVEKFPEFVALETLKTDPKLEGMLVARRGMRLSVQPVAPRTSSACSSSARRRHGCGEPRAG